MTLIKAKLQASGEAHVKRPPQWLLRDEGRVRHITGHWQGN